MRRSIARPPVGGARHGARSLLFHVGGLAPPSYGAVRPYKAYRVVVYYVRAGMENTFAIGTRGTTINHGGTTLDAEALRVRL